jgi:hypothetical protein
MSLDHTDDGDKSQRRVLRRTIHFRRLERLPRLV